MRMLSDILDSAGFGLAVGATLILGVGLLIYNANRAVDARIAEAIQAGVSPEAAYCTFRAEATNARCVAFYAGRAR